MGSELVSTDISRQEISPLKSEVDIKKEPKEPEENATSSEVKAETEDVKPDTGAAGADVKTESTAGM